jgi:hypothetical protein
MLHDQFALDLDHEQLLKFQPAALRCKVLIKSKRRSQLVWQSGDADMAESSANVSSVWKSMLMASVV